MGEKQSARLPRADVINTINKWVRTSRQMYQAQGHEPTAEDLARSLAMPLERVRRLLATAAACAAWRLVASDRCAAARMRYAGRGRNANVD